MRFERLLAIRLVSHDARALAEFYVAALGFACGATTRIAASELALLGVAGTGSRMALMLGEQVLEIDQFDPPGRPYPQPRASDDRLFQHFAMVTGDMPGAWARVLAAGGAPVSAGGPVQLPPENGSVTAVKFRDPEGHPLELLSFPQAQACADGGGAHGTVRGDRMWRNIAGAPPPASLVPLPVPGRIDPRAIDHSAIVVRDVTASLDFYQARGLTVGDRTLNHGAAQAALDGLPDPRVDVVPLNPPGEGPHLELLGYHDPAPRREAPWHPRDIAATRLVWEAAEAALVTDPDGHLHQCQPPRTPRASPPATG